MKLRKIHVTFIKFQIILKFCDITIRGFISDSSLCFTLKGYWLCGSNEEFVLWCCSAVAGNVIKLAISMS